MLLCMVVDQEDYPNAHQPVTLEGGQSESYHGRIAYISVMGRGEEGVLNDRGSALQPKPDQFVTSCQLIITPEYFALSVNGHGGIFLLSAPHQLPVCRKKGCNQ